MKIDWSRHTGSREGNAIFSRHCNNKHFCHKRTKPILTQAKGSDVIIDHAYEFRQAFFLKYSVDFEMIR